MLKIFSLAFSLWLLAFCLDNSFAVEGQSNEAQEPESVDAPTDAAPEPAPPTVQPPQADAAISEEEIPTFDDENKWNPLPIAKLQGLNKVTAKTSEIKVKVGESTKFGNLNITIKKCSKKPDSEKNESVALMEIWDEIPGQTRNKSFYGWMFSASPAISALEHPIYDVILLECVGAGAKKKADESKEQKSDVKKQ